MSVFSSIPKLSPLKTGLVLAITIGAFDDMAIATILPLIATELGGEQYYGAAFSSFVLASLFATVWAGKQCDVRGPRRPFILGLVLFAVGFLLAAIAPSMPIFVLARTVQGLGNGIIMALVFAVINLAYDKDQRPAALALISAAWVIPSLIAPTGAGIIAEYAHWRWVFPGLIPFLFLTAWLTLPVLKRYDVSDPTLGTTNTLVPAFRLSAGVALVLAMISQQDLSPLIVLGGVIFGVVISFKPFEMFMPAKIWSLGTGLAAAMGLRFSLNFVFFGCEVLLPYMLIQKYGFTAIEAGVVLTSSAIAWALGSQFQARLSSRLSTQVFLYIGGGLMCLAIVGIVSLVLFSVSVYWVYLFWSLAGFGVGTCFTCISAYAMSHTPVGEEGLQASAAGVSSALGVGLATGLAGAILNYGSHNEIALETTLLVLWAMTFLVAGLFLLIVRTRVVSTIR